MIWPSSPARPSSATTPTSPAITCRTACGCGMSRTIPPRPHAPRSGTASSATRSWPSSSCCRWCPTASAASRSSPRCHTGFPSLPQTSAVRTAAGLPIAREVFDELRRICPAHAVLVEESPSNLGDLHAAWPITRPDAFYTMASGGLGWSVPASVGIALAERDSGRNRPVVMVAGDGSFQYSLQSIWTAARLKLPILFVVLRNGEYAILKAFGPRGHPRRAAIRSRRRRYPKRADGTRGPDRRGGTSAAVIPRREPGPWRDETRGGIAAGPSPAPTRPLRSSTPT